VTTPPVPRTGTLVQFPLGERLDMTYWARGVLDETGTLTVDGAAIGHVKLRPRRWKLPLAEPDEVTRILWPESVEWPTRPVRYHVDAGLTADARLDVDGVLTITGVYPTPPRGNGFRTASARDVTRVVWADGVLKPEGLEER